MRKNITILSTRLTLLLQVVPTFVMMVSGRLHYNECLYLLETLILLCGIIHKDIVDSYSHYQSISQSATGAIM